MEGVRAPLYAARRLLVQNRAADVLLVSVVTISASAWAFWWPTTSQDEFSLLIYADLISQGRVPNRDFFAPYGPGTFWPLTALYAVTGGPSIAAARGLGVAYHLLIALGVWSLARRRGRVAAVVAGSVSGCLSAGLLLIPYGWLLALGSTVWALVATTRSRWVLAGVLAAAACTVRPEFLAVVLPTLAVQLPNLRAGLRFAAGLLLGAVPLLVHVALAGPQLLRNVFLDRLGVDARLPLVPESAQLGVLLLLLASSVLVLVVSAIWRRKRLDIAVMILVLGIVPQTLQRVDREHVLLVAVVSVPLALATLGSLVRAAAPPAIFLVLGRRVAVGACVAAAVFGTVISAVAPHGQLVTINGRTMYSADAWAAGQLRLEVEAIESLLRPGDRMFVGAVDMSRPAITVTYLYYFLPAHVPDAYYLELAPGVAEKSGSRLIRDVADSDVLILTPFRAWQRLFPRLKRGSTQVNDYVDEKFCPIDRVGAMGSSTLLIYRRC